MPPPEERAVVKPGSRLATQVATQTAALLDTLRDWPWADTVRTLGQRFREDRLGLSAGSLTFTTLIARWCRCSP